MIETSCLRGGERYAACRGDAAEIAQIKNTPTGRLGCLL